MPTLPPFAVTSIGSWPRPAWLLDAVKRGRKDLAQFQDQATLLAIKLQEDAGVDIVTDGEQRRDNFFSFVADRLDGVELMTLADILDHVENKAAFEAMLSALDVPAFAIKNPVVTGKIRVKKPLAMDDFRFLREHTRKPVKVTLPGPYQLSRATWVQSLTSSAYSSREAMTDDFVKVLREELQALAAAGADVVQFDEPVLSEILFAGKSNTHTFMCGVLAAKASPEGELDYAVDLINRVVDGVSGPITAVHVCRGNWSRDESVLLEGGYEALMPWLSRMKVRQFALEYATPRAGRLEAVAGLPKGKMLGLGVVNPRSSEIESVDWITGRARVAANILGAENIFLNPDCGFGTFSDRPVSSADIAFGKLRALSNAAKALRSQS